MADTELSLGARALLTMLRRESGWWSVSQLFHHWQPTWSSGEIELHLAALCRAGYVVSRPSLASSSRNTYSAALQAGVMPVGPGATSNVVQLQRKVA